MYAKFPSKGRKTVLCFVQIFTKRCLPFLKTASPRVTPIHLTVCIYLCSWRFCVLVKASDYFIPPSMVIPKHLQVKINFSITI